MAALAFFITLGFFCALGYMMAVGVKQIGSGQGGEAVLIMLGSLGTAWSGIVAFYFGSSVGAQKNAETIARMAATQNGYPVPAQSSPPPTIKAVS
jgi:hypothetical protein